MSAGRHASAESLVDQAAQFRSWDRLRRAVWVFDPNTLRGLYANPAAIELWDSGDLGELLSRDFSKLSPAVLARTARLAQATASGGALVEPWTFFPNGLPITVKATISTILTDEQQPVLLFEASPLEMEPEERRAMEALRHTSTLITLFGSAGNPIFSNPAAFLAYGVNPPRFEEGFRDPALARDLLCRVQAGDIVGEVCEMIVRGGARWHHLDIREVLDPATGSPGVLLTEIDVTQRVQADRARVAAEEKAAMAEAREQFLTDMSHDLRTPLNAVIGFSALLRASGIAPEQIVQAERIHESGVKLLSLVDEMIHLSDERWIEQPPSPKFEIQANNALTAADFTIQRSMRVLYVDDNAHNRALVTAVLGAQGIFCQTANDGAEGFEVATFAPWDLILMDIQMPVMTGVEASRAIRSSESAARHTPIVAVTANTLQPQLAEYRDAGMDGCIAKPIDIADLVTTVLAWTGASETGDLSACA